MQHQQPWCSSCWCQRPTVFASYVILINHSQCIGEKHRCCYSSLFFTSTVDQAILFMSDRRDLHRVRTWERFTTRLICDNCFSQGHGCQLGSRTGGCPKKWRNILLWRGLTLSAYRCWMFESNEQCGIFAFWLSWDETFQRFLAAIVKTADICFDTSLQLAARELSRGDRPGSMAIRVLTLFFIINHLPSLGNTYRG